MEEMDHHFMLEALEEARKAARIDEVPIGAVVVLDGKIVGRGHNRRETLQQADAHAEILAIREACETIGSWRLDGCTLYVPLEPCPMCAGAAIQSRVKRLVYGAKDNKNGAHVSGINVFAGEFNHEVQVEGGLLGEDSRRLLLDFFKALRSSRDKV